MGRLDRYLTEGIRALFVGRGRLRGTPDDDQTTPVDGSTASLAPRSIEELRVTIPSLRATCGSRHGSWKRAG
jgi:hypothetical protein